MEIEKFIKFCPRCKKTLPVISFDRDRQKSDGLRTRCRDCLKQDRIRHRKSNPYREWARNVLQSRRQAGFTTEITPRQLADIARQTPVCPSCHTVLVWDRADDESIAFHPHKSSMWTPHLITSKKTITPESIMIVCRKCFYGFVQIITPQVVIPPAHVEDLGRTSSGSQVLKICFDEEAP